MQNYYEKAYNLEDIKKKLREQYPEGTLPEELPDDIVKPFIPAQNPNYDVHVSNDTVKMEGRPESLPSQVPSTSPLPESKWELIKGTPQETPQPPKSEPDVVKSEPIAKVETKLEDVFPVTDNDKAAREAGMADLEKQRKRNIVTELAAGAGDAISAAASAFGGNAPGGSQARLVERHAKDMEQGKKDIEQKLRNDPNSDISKQYQDLVARFMQKDPKDPMLLGLTANQIAEKIPQIEKLVSLRQQDELKRAQIDANREVRLSREAAAQDKLDLKSKEANEKKELAITNAKQEAGIIRQAIKDIKDRKLVGYDTTGALSSGVFAPFDKPDLAEKLRTIMGNIGLATLTKLKQASPTGGALGPVSDKEMALLTSVKGSLSQDQSPQQLLQALDDIDKIYEKIGEYDVDVQSRIPGAESPTSFTSKSGFKFTKGNQR